MNNLRGFDYRKAVQTVNFFAHKEGGEIDKLKLLKLVYLADRYHLRKYGRPVVNDQYWAMQYGPVASSVKDIVSFASDDADENGYTSEFLDKKEDNPNILISKKEIDTSFLSKSDCEALEFVYANFGNLSASRLVSLTHTYPEWNKFESVLNTGGTKRMEMSYEDFFLQPESTNSKDLIVPPEQLQVARDVYLETVEVAKALNS